MAFFANQTRNTADKITLTGNLEVSATINDPLVSFCVGHASTDEPQSKHHEIGNDGAVATRPPRFASAGSLRHVCCPLSQFASHFTEANSFAVLGVPVGSEPGQEVQLTTARQEAGHSKGIARTASNFCWPDGNSLLMLDIDLKTDHCVPPMPSSLGTSEVINLLEQALGISMEGVAYLVRPSASTGIYHADDARLLKNSSGFHVYFALKGSTPDKVLESLHKRLVIAGHGHAYINACGRILIRTPFDAAVGQTNRVDFAASPTLGAGLIHRPPLDAFQAGSALDLTGVDLSVDEGVYKAALQKLKQQADIVDMRLDRSTVWIQDRAAQFEDSMTPEDAWAMAANLGQRILSDESVDLFPEDKVTFHFDHGERIDLLSLLGRALEFDGLSLADPFDEDATPCKAKFYDNADTGKPCIHSFAHGGLRYFLHARNERDLYFPDEQARDCFSVYDEPCGYPGRLNHDPGLYEHKMEMRGRGRERELETVDYYIGAPLRVTAGTSDLKGNQHGLVLEFKDIQDRPHRWAMPAMGCSESSMGRDTK